MASNKGKVSFSQNIVLCVGVEYTLQASTLISSLGCQLTFSLDGITVALSSNVVGGGWKETRQVATVVGTGLPVILKVSGTCDGPRLGYQASNMILDDIALLAFA